MMKQILLRVSAVFAEICSGKLAQITGRHFSFPREIFFLQDALDPDIDRESAQAFVGKEHHTISNLCAHARQLAKLCPKIDIGKHRPFFQIGFARGDQSRRGQQILRAITERAFAQFFLVLPASRDGAGNVKKTELSILRRSPKRSRNFLEICRMCATCFIEEVMNVARHSHFGWRMMRSPRQ